MYDQWIKIGNDFLTRVLNSHTIKYIIIDLRNNGGGYLAPMIEMLSLIINDGLIFSLTKSLNSKTDNNLINVSLSNSKLKYHHNEPRKIKTLPITTYVLINNKTMSSAEFLAMILKSMNAKLIGERTGGFLTNNQTLFVENIVLNITSHYVKNMNGQLQINTYLESDFSKLKKIEIIIENL
jgi:C-terminal processing protease CtpA/Prc